MKRKEASRGSEHDVLADRTDHSLLAPVTRSEVTQSKEAESPLFIWYTGSMRTTIRALAWRAGLALGCQYTFSRPLQIPLDTGIKVVGHHPETKEIPHII